MKYWQTSAGRHMRRTSTAVRLLVRCCGRLRQRDPLRAVNRNAPTVRTIRNLLLRYDLVNSCQRNRQTTSQLVYVLMYVYVVCIRMYLCMYQCMYVSMYEYVYVCINVYMCIHIYTSMHLCV